MKLAVAFLIGLAFESAVSLTQAADYSSKSTVPISPPTAAVVRRAPAIKAVLENVIIVYKTHFDIGYTTMAREVVHEYRTEMADRVLDAIEKNSRQPKEQQFVWTLSGWPMKQILWEGQPPERRQKIEQAIRDGNLVVHAYPFTTHTETAELEDLVRGLNISSTLDRQFGLPLVHGREDERRAGAVVDLSHAVRPRRHQVLSHGRPAW